jgi:hypothetical protein
MSDFKIVNRNKSNQSGNILNRGSKIDETKGKVITTPLQEKNRKTRRSADLIEAVKQIDVQTDPAMKQAIIDWVHAEYDKRGGGELIGLFSKCYLGHPYCDHRMDISGSIIEHYKIDENVPPAYARARPLAASGSYAYVEVYADGAVIPVRADGTV